MRTVIEGGPLAWPPHLPEIIVITDGGPWAQHNHPCPVCSQRHAILDLGTGAFGPCGDCVAAGWRLTRRRRRWWRR